jgi:Cu-processing system permease protein
MCDRERRPMNTRTRVSAVLVIARQEIRVTLRSRWVLLYAVIFGVLSLTVAYFGLAVIEFTGFQDFTRTSASLLNLVLYVVPVGAMLMTVQSFRPEGGANDHLFVEPVSFAQIVLGKILGLSGTHALSLLLGFSLTAALIIFHIGPAGISGYLALVVFGFLLGVCFISLASLVTVVSGRGAQAHAASLVVWFFLVILYDLVVVGVSLLVPIRWAGRVALAGVLLNPVDATRVGATLAAVGRELFGPAGAELVRSLGGTHQAIAFLVAALLFWIVMPACLTIQALKRTDL